MIRIEHTPHYAGAIISGDFYDFEELYDALHHIAQDEEELEGYGGPRLRVLGFCFEMRQALMGKRGSQKVPNSSGHNLYFNLNVLWPELLFLSFALNDFIVHFKALHTWDPTVAAVRKFQSAVARCLADTFLPPHFRQLKKYIDLRDEFGKNKYQHYFVQYIDSLNVQHLKLPFEKRAGHILVAAQRISELDSLYAAFRNEYADAAEETGLPFSHLPFKEAYPKDFVW